jgi:oligoendopeptidase F
VHKKYYALTDRVMTLMTIANIRFDIDTSDKFYEEEHKYYDEQGPVFSNLVLAYQKKLYESPYRAYLEEKIGPVAFKNMELAQKSMSEALIPLMQEENSLTMEYDKLIAGAKIDFDGRELNLSLLRPYLVNCDRNVRRRAWEKMSAFFLENEEQLDTIYDKLVKNRTAQARAMGYENYLELGYYRMNRNCYGKDEVEAFRRQIKEYFVPFAESCMTAEDNVWVWRSSAISTSRYISRMATRHPPEPPKRSWQPDRRCTVSCPRRLRNFLIS